MVHRREDSLPAYLTGKKTVYKILLGPSILYANATFGMVPFPLIAQNFLKTLVYGEQ